MHLAHDAAGKVEIKKSDPTGNLSRVSALCDVVGGAKTLTMANSGITSGRDVPIEKGDFGRPLSRREGGRRVSARQAHNYVGVGTQEKARGSSALSDRFRLARDVQLRALIRSCAAATRTIRILDMGGTVEYWRRVGVDFLRAHGARVTLLNLAESELSPITHDDDIFFAAVGDACKMDQYADNAFDLAHSNSVIEHVGTWGRMKAFAAETRRVAPSYYVQTPYFWFPIDPHYYRAPMFHWFPRPLRAGLLRRFSIAHCGKAANVDQAYEIIDQARLLDAGQFRFLFPDAQVNFERFLGLAKSMVGVRNASTTTGP